MNALIFSDADAQELIQDQSGQHRLSPVQLTDGRWFLMADVLAEATGLYAGKLHVPYEVVPFAALTGLLPVAADAV